MIRGKRLTGAEGAINFAKTDVYGARTDPYGAKYSGMVQRDSLSSIHNISTMKERCKIRCAITHDSS